MTKYAIKGIGEVELTQRDFIAAGGQSKVFSKGNVAYKIYEDQTKMLPTGKIQELAVLKHPNIIKPESLILDSKNKLVGYTMKYVKGLALCQLFTKAFCQRNSIDNNIKLNLTKKLYELVQYIHQNQILIVDCNELNFLVNDKFTEVYGIDTDSYQTKSYPATVIMDNIRDRQCHHNAFSTETDWFSWGILAFQMLIGVHPYKGGHPDFSNLPLDRRMNARMEKNVSAFNPKSTLPAIAQSFDVIPSGLRQWMIAVYENGKRLAPPKDFDGILVIAPIIKTITGSHLFKIVEMDNYPSEIISYFSHQGETLVHTDKNVHFGKKTYSIPSNDVCFTFTPKNNQLIAVYLEDESVKIYDVVNQTFIQSSFNSNNVMEYDGRIYLQSLTNILELNFIEIGKNIQCSTKIVGRVLDIPGATQVFDGVIVQNMLGRYIVSLFAKAGHCYQLNMAELDGYKIVDAKFQNNVLVVVRIKRNGNKDRFVFRMSNDYSAYDVRKIENVSIVNINFTVNDANVCILINEDENIEMFSNKKDSAVKVISDPAITSDMKLCHDGAKIMFSKNNKLYSFSMK